MICLDLIDHKLLSVKVHDVQAGKGLICHLGIEESGVVELDRQLILTELGVCALLLYRHLDVKHRQAVGLLQAHTGRLLLWLDICIGVGCKLLLPLLTLDPEAPIQIIKLTDQLNDHIHDLPISPEGCLVGIPAQLAASLLHSRNRRCGSNTGCGTAVGNIPVAGDLLQLIDLVLHQGDVVAVESLTLHRHHAVLTQIAVHVDEVLAQIRKFLLIHRAIRADKVPGPGVDQKILQHRLIALVDVFLSALCQVYIPKAAGATLHPEHRIKYKGIHAVVIPTTIPVLFVVFSGKQHRVAHILAVVQYRAAALKFLIIPIHHQALAICADGIIVDILADCGGRASQLSLQLWILLLQLLIVPQLQTEEVL